MRNVKWLLAAGLVAATTAACTAETGYYPSSYGYPSTYYSRGYYYNNTPYYTSNTAYRSGYYYNSTPRRGPYGDYDRDGVANRYDRDANGDGVPDRFQR
jgi:hypothetical protein